MLIVETLLCLGCYNTFFLSRITFLNNIVYFMLFLCIIRIKAQKTFVTAPWKVSKDLYLYRLDSKWKVIVYDVHFLIQRLKTGTREPFSPAGRHSKSYSLNIRLFTETFWTFLVQKFFFPEIVKVPSNGQLRPSRLFLFLFLFCFRKRHLSG